MHRRSFLFAPWACTLAQQARAAGNQRHLGFEKLPDRGGINFQHAASHTGEKYLPESMGAGVAMLDYNNDGFLDLFFVNGAALRTPMRAGARPDKSDPRFWNRLYRNNGDGTFTDVTEAAGLRGNGYGMGVAVGDFDNDGFPDLYITNLGSNTLYRNNGDGTFTDITEKAGVKCGGWSAGACFFDYDRDGKLDLFVTRYLDWDFDKNIYCGEHRDGYRSYCHPDQFKPTTHMLFHNNGNGTFTDVSARAGFSGKPSKGLGVAIADFDRDGWPDIAVANDSYPEQLFRNNRNGTFTEIGTELGLAYDEDGKTFAGMGIDAADYGNQDWPGVFINALANQRYALFENHDGKMFEYVSGRSGISKATMLHSGWGAKFFDFDNDGWKDLFVAQGHVMDNIELTQPSSRYREPLLLLRNNGGKFEDISMQVGSEFSKPLAARGAAVGDINNDGWMDIAINCNDGPAIVLLNRGGNGNHWLSVNTVGSKSNRDGIGCCVRIVSASGREQTMYVSTAGSYLSASDKRVHFGLGADRVAKLVEITWPNGTVQRLENVTADRILTVKEP